MTTSDWVSKGVVRTAFETCYWNIHAPINFQGEPKISWIPIGAALGLV